MKTAMSITALLVCIVTANLSAQQAQYDVSLLLNLSQQPESEVQKVGFPRPKLVVPTQRGVVIEEMELIDVIRQQVAPESWKDPRNNLFCEKSVLYVTHQSDEVCKDIAQLLNALEKIMTAQVDMHVQVYEMPTGEFMRKFSGQPLSHLATSSLDKREEGAAKPTGNMRLIGFSGSQIDLQTTRKKWYLRDKDVEVAAKYAIVDPMTSWIDEGQQCTATVYATPDGKVYLQGGFLSANCDSLRTFDGKSLGKWQLPSVKLQGFMGSYNLSGGTDTFGVYSQGEVVKIVQAKAQLRQQMVDKSSKWIAFDLRYFLKSKESYDVADYLSPVDILHQAEAEPIIAAEFTEIQGSTAEKKLLLEKIKGSFFYRDFLLVPMGKKEEATKEIATLARKETETVQLRFAEYIITAKSQEVISTVAIGDNPTSMENSLLQYVNQVQYLQTSASKGQQVVAHSLTSHDYVKDYDVEIAEAAGSFDPVIGSVSDGLQVEASVLAIQSDKVLLQIHAISTTVDLPMQKIAVSDCEAELPQFSYHQSKGQYMVGKNKLYVFDIAQHEGNLRILTVRVE